MTCIIAVLAGAVSRVSEREYVQPFCCKLNPKQGLKPVKPIFLDDHRRDDNRGTLLLASKVHQPDQDQQGLDLRQEDQLGATDCSGDNQDYFFDRFASEFSLLRFVTFF